MLDGSQYGWQVGAGLAEAYEGPVIYTREDAREIGNAALAYLRLTPIAQSLLYPEQDFLASFVAGFLYWSITEKVTAPAQGTGSLSWAPRVQVPL